MSAAEEFLKKLLAGGEIVAAKDCTQAEITHARQRGRLYVPDGLVGYICRPPTRQAKLLGETVKLTDGRTGKVVSMRRTFRDGRLGWNLGIKLPDGDIVRAGCNEVVSCTT